MEKDEGEQEEMFCTDMFGNVTLDDFNLTITMMMMMIMMIMTAMHQIRAMSSIMRNLRQILIMKISYITKMLLATMIYRLITL